jgi:DNA polymerase-1
VPEHILAVIDGNSLLHRAFHALPVTMTAPDGRPTNAAYGFISMLLKLTESFDPDTVVAAFDKGRPAFRTEALARYKIHRPPTPDELRPQFGIVKELLGAMSVPVVECEGWEGDDLLGTLALRGEEAGMRVLLFTGDKDAYQLVTDRVSVVTTKQGITDIVVYDPAAVEARLGVRPDQVADYLGLKGDTSDNIPGVPGIGEKTAAKLIQTYGSLDEVLAHADEVPGRVGVNLRENAEEARVSRQVATIRRDVPVDCEIEVRSWGAIDPDAVARTFTPYRMVSLVERILALGRAHAGKLAEASAPAASEPPTAPDAWPVRRSDDGDRALQKALDAAESVAASFEADDGSLFPCGDLAFALPSREVAFVAAERAGDALTAALTGAAVVAPDLKALVQRFAPPGDRESRLGRFSEAWEPVRTFDVAVAGYVLESNRSAYDVATLYAEYFGRSLPEPDDPAARQAARAQGTLELAAELRHRLEQDAGWECYSRCELPLIPVLARMEDVGLGVDSDALGQLAEEFGARIDRVRTEIFELAGTEFTIDSPKQLGEVLFDKLQLPVGRRTKTGYSTDAKVLAQLAASHPIAAKVTEYRELTKLKSTYVDALPRLLGEDGRLHTTFNQTVAATGRLSSSNPNLQNIPIRTDLGRRIRRAFVPARQKDVIVSADYSQIELRVLADLSGDEALGEAFISGRDFHTETAARVFELDRDHVDPEHRRRAKAVNFGIVYGISAHGLSQSIGVDRGEAQAMIDRYFAAYPKVRIFLDETVAEAHRTGYAVTRYGRRRHIPELRSSNYSIRSFGERTAMNHPMQGTAADIMKLAMIDVDRRIREDGFAARMVLQVHDELVFESPRDELDALADMVRDAMENVDRLAVPLVADVNWGEDWASAK